LFLKNEHQVIKKDTLFNKINNLRHDK